MLFLYPSPPSPPAPLARRTHLFLSSPPRKTGRYYDLPVPEPDFSEPTNPEEEVRDSLTFQINYFKKKKKNNSSCWAYV